MQGRTQRADKQQDRSVRSGTGPVQQLHKNAQDITGTVQNLERKLHQLDAGKVAAVRTGWSFAKMILAFLITLFSAHTNFLQILLLTW